ncbi:hypothetical protein KCP74_04870 [Salmonella enterica subsp. enterica]|nr:hypothetical protein KCP74_04870 [Salmonella enterica subsp. enterica]
MKCRTIYARSPRRYSGAAGEPKRITLPVILIWKSRKSLTARRVPVTGVAV